MKKKLFVTIGILIIFFNIFISLQIGKNLVNNAFFDKSKMEIIHDLDKPPYSRQELVDNLISFSIKENIEIAQYRYISPKKIDIYSTNPSDYKVVLNLMNFLYDKELKVHNFNDLIATGGFNIYYLSKGSEESLSKIREEFKDYGELKISEIKQNNDLSLDYFMNFINPQIISVFCLTGIIILVMIIIFNVYANLKVYHSNN